jgi:hypothetical protein
MSATAGILVNTVTEEIVENIIITMAAKETGKEFTKKLTYEAIERAIIQTMGPGSKEIIKNASFIVGEQAGKEVLN